jgi:hypothetical protein
MPRLKKKGLTGPVAVVAEPSALAQRMIQDGTGESGHEEPGVLTQR